MSKIEESAHRLQTHLDTLACQAGVGIGDVNLYVYCNTLTDKEKVPYTWESYNVIARVVGKLWTAKRL